MVESIIFDIDGTLVDSVDLHARAWWEALARFDVVVPYPIVRSQIGKGGDQLLPPLVPRERLDEIREPLLKDRSQRFRREYLPQVRAFPSVRALFLKLRQDGKRLALASSAKAAEIEVYERIAEISDLVDVRVNSEDVERSKPHPDVVHVTLERLGSPDPGNCRMIGDTPYDAEAAVGAGVAPVGVLCGGFPEDGLRQAGCHVVYRHPADLLDRYLRVGDAAFGPAQVPAEFTPK